MRRDLHAGLDEGEASLAAAWHLRLARPQVRARAKCPWHPKTND